MRKILFVFAMLGAFVFSGCQNENPPIDIPITCESGEELQNGVCVIIPITCASYEELQNGTCVIVDMDAKLISDVFGQMETFDDYTLEIIVQNQLELYYITIEFDDNKSSFEIDGNKEYYMYDNDINEHYFKQGDSYQKETSSEPLSDNFLFFYNLDATMFTPSETNGKYFLNIQNYSEIVTFFEQEFSGCTVQNFELSIDSEQISQMIFDLVVDEITYHMVMNFSLVGETSITIPVV